jgi:general secretion pathway protein E
MTHSSRELALQITPVVLKMAREACLLHNTPMSDALVEALGCSPALLMEALGIVFDYPVLQMTDLHVLQPRFDIISYIQCLQRGLLLARDESDTLCLVQIDPFDGMNEDWALRQCAAYGVVPKIVLAISVEFGACLALLERQLKAMDGFDSHSSQGVDEDVAAVITLSSINDDPSPVVRLVNSTIYDALKLQASDIHLECDAGSLHVQYRIDGVLIPITQVQGKDIAEQIISRVKVMADLDIAERRTPQDGRFKVRVNGREVDFRVSVMPNIFGEDAVLRLLDRQSLTEEQKALRLENLGLGGNTIAAIRKLANKPHGMLLVTGPTGSGKTTTLYAAITEIQGGGDKIITIEDPVEYRLPRVLQIPVNEKKGLTFARGLRSILRHDPDRIMVGEIRDDETAQIAVQAALTGHLVFTTVHANNVFDVLGRFLHMGVDPYSFSAALNGVVAQRLVRLNCTQCASAEIPSEEELVSAGLESADLQGWKFLVGQGCGHCRGVGYKGRRAVAEVLIIDDTLREMITTRAPISVLKQYATQAGLQTLRDEALRWVSRGETTLSEVLRVVG